MTNEPQVLEPGVAEVEEPAARSALPAVRPEMGLVDVESAVAEWEAYQELTRRLLNDSDYQKIGRSRFKKKSAWRKYARAFNVSCEQVSVEIHRSDDGFPLYARIVVRATDPTGRFQDGEQECHVKERCCERPCRKANWDKHYCCPANCTGRQHFSHPGDLSSTAFTRAKNRAIADLIGAGEVSAEEMQDTAEEEASPARPKQSRSRKQAPAAREANGGAEAAKARYDLTKALDKRFKGDEQAAFEYVEGKFPEACEGTRINYSQIPEAMCSELIEQLPEPAKQGEMMEA